MDCSSGQRWLEIVAAAILAVLMSGCATPPPYDYGAFRQSRPASLLVLPPLNDSPDVKATAGVWAQATMPLAEAGYYVLPVALVDETFKNNGLTTAADIHDVAALKLREIFGADAAVYLRVKKYGSTYAVLASETRVEVEARIVDLRSGQTIWQGQAVASSAESNSSNQGGLVGLLIQAVVTQILSSATDASFRYAGVANQRLLGAPRRNGILLGPRSPNHGKD
jgi:hypothetical protein